MYLLLKITNIECETKQRTNLTEINNNYAIFEKSDSDFMILNKTEASNEKLAFLPMYEHNNYNLSQAMSSKTFFMLNSAETKIYPACKC